MTDGTLDLLASFRSEIPEPDDATAQRIYLLATTTSPPRSRAVPRLGRTSSRFSSRARLAIAAAVVALIVVPTAIAIGGGIVDLFRGTPAPPSISSTFAKQNKMADPTTQQGFALKFPQADVSKAHGVIEIQTADGPEDLWAAPNSEGGVCWLIDFPNDTPGPDGPLTSGGCDSSRVTLTIAPGDVWVKWHPSLVTVYGRVYVDATHVELTFDDGSTRTVPVVEGFFLDSTAPGLKLTRVTAYDASGSQIADWTPPS